MINKSSPDCRMVRSAMVPVRRGFTVPSRTFRAGQDQNTVLRFVFLTSLPAILLVWSLLIHTLLQNF